MKFNIRVLIFVAAVAAHERRLDIIIHSHFQLLSVVMTNSQELSVLLGGRVGCGSRRTDDENVKLSYQIRQLL